MSAHEAHNNSASRFNPSITPQSLSPSSPASNIIHHGSPSYIPLQVPWEAQIYATTAESTYYTRGETQAEPTLFYNSPSFPHHQGDYPGNFDHDTAIWGTEACFFIPQTILWHHWGTICFWSLVLVLLFLSFYVCRFLMGCDRCGLGMGNSPLDRFPFDCFM